jgi:hypothetical protein
VNGARVRAARVVGLWRGRELDLVLPLTRDGRSVQLGAPPDPVLAIAPEAIDGWQAEPGRATLYLAGGDVLEITTRDDEAREQLRLALDSVATVPELTRSLRHLGAASVDDAAVHDAWFGPFLRARAAIEGVTDPLRQAALVDADRIAMEVSRTLEELARRRAGGDGPRARALVAELEEETAAVPAAVARLGLAASALAGSAPDSRLIDWRRWVEALRELARALDAGWPAVQRTVG